MDSETNKPPDKVPNSEPTNDQSTYQSQDPPPDNTSAEHNCYSEIISAKNGYDSKNYRLQKWHLRVQFAVFFVASCAAAAAIYYAHVAHKQWEVMNKTYGEIQKQTTSAEISANAARKSADIAEDTMVATERPWLNVRLRPGSDLQFDEHGGLIIIDFIIKNVGHSPAFNIYPFGQILILSRQGTDLGAEQTKVFAVGQNVFNNKRNLKDSSLGYVLFPTDEFSLSWPVTFSRKDIEEGYRMTKSKIIAPILFGCVFYRFAFDQSVHKTGFIVNINRLDPSKSIPRL